MSMHPWLQYKQTNRNWIESEICSLTFYSVDSPRWKQYEKTNTEKRDKVYTTANWFYSDITLIVYITQSMMGTLAKKEIMCLI